MIDIKRDKMAFIWLGKVLMDLLTSLRGQLERNVWTAGQRLPSIRKMAATCQLSCHTVITTYAQLVSEGLLEAHQGQGFFVTHKAANIEKNRSTEIKLKEAPLYKLLQAPPEYLKLGCGWLPSAWRDTESLAKAIRKTARTGHNALTEYGDTQGYLPLRKKLSVHLSKHTQIDVDPQQILTTLGATQALDLVSHLLIQPGDYVLVDEPCNGNLIKLIKLHGGVPVGIPRLSDGPDLAFLDEILNLYDFKAFFCNSTYHNPTGSCLSPQIAFNILKRAVEHDFIIVEDDVYGDFFPGVHQTFAQLDNFKNVIYIGSFSKSLSASLRIGYIVCTPPLVESLRQLKLLTSVAVPGFCERFVNTILSDGTYIRHTQSIQRQLMMSQKDGQKLLKKYGWKTEMAPRGGMFLWVEHPDMDDLSDFIERLELKKILLMPGESFSVSSNFKHKTRINVAHITAETMCAFEV